MRYRPGRQASGPCAAMRQKKTPPTEVGGVQGRTTCLTASSAATSGVGAGWRHSGRSPGRRCRPGGASATCAGDDGTAVAASLRSVTVSGVGRRRASGRPASRRGRRLFIGRSAAELNGAGGRRYRLKPLRAPAAAVPRAEWSISGGSGRGRRRRFGRNMGHRPSSIAVAPCRVLVSSDCWLPPPSRLVAPIHGLVCEADGGLSRGSQASRGPWRGSRSASASARGGRPAGWPMPALPGLRGRANG